MAVGWSPHADVSPGQLDEATASRSEPCFAVLRRAGIEITDANTAINALIVCETVGLFASAAHRIFAFDDRCTCLRYTSGLHPM